MAACSMQRFALSVTSDHQCRRLLWTRDGAYATPDIPRPAGKSAGLRDDAFVELVGLPAAGLEHVGFVQGADGEAFHRSGEVFADFK